MSKKEVKDGNFEIENVRLSFQILVSYVVQSAQPCLQLDGAFMYGVNTSIILAFTIVVRTKRRRRREILNIL